VSRAPEKIPLIGSSKPRVGGMHWERGLDGHDAVMDTLAELGCEVTSFAFDAELPEDLDAIVAVGPL